MFVGHGSGRGTEDATASTDAQMMAAMQASAFAVEKKGHEEGKENGNKMETRKDTCPQCQTVTRPPKPRAPAGTTDTKATDVQMPLHHLQSLSHTWALSTCQRLH